MAELDAYGKAVSGFTTKTTRNTDGTALVHLEGDARYHPVLKLGATDAREVLQGLSPLAPSPEPPIPVPPPTAQLLGANLHSHGNPYGTPVADLLREINLLASNHGKLGRIACEWKAIEWTQGLPGGPYLEAIDAQVKEATAKGIKTILTACDTPEWAGLYAKPAAWNSVPNPALLAKYCRFLGTRYGPGQLAGIEIYNEPNNPYEPYLLNSEGKWGGTAAAKDYAAMVIAVYNECKGIVPIIAGAISYFDQPFLDALYANGIKGHFDGFSIHPYADGAAPSNTAVTHSFKGGIEKLHAYLTAKEDAKPIWPTEFGNKVGELSSETLRAQYTKENFVVVKALPYVAGATIYELRSKADNFGLVASDFTPWPSLAAFGEALA